MGINIHRSADRGVAEHGWLHSRFSFSFADYYNPERMGFGALRVLNDDIIEPAKGFGFHSHKNMEIVTIVLEGSLEHKDSMGNTGVIKVGEVQRMSAGTGVVHSEFNASKKETARLLQIWVYPKEQNIEPSYEQKSFQKKGFENKLQAIVSGNKKVGALYLHQNAEFLLGSFWTGKSFSHTLLGINNGLFVFLIEGKMQVEEEIIEKLDSAEISHAKKIEFYALEKSKALLIEVPLNFEE
ncbi:MAG: pirin family protein [Candidatus Diapherotrites archaeon]|nr:pirin family protein [Candidatus Diapherotrites archaeon]